MCNSWILLYTVRIHNKLSEFVCMDCRFEIKFARLHFKNCETIKVKSEYLAQN